MLAIQGGEDQNKNKKKVEKRRRSESTKKSAGPVPKRARTDVRPITMNPVGDWSLNELAYDTLNIIFAHVPAYDRRFMMRTCSTWHKLLNEPPLCYLPVPPLVGILSLPLHLSASAGAEAKIPKDLSVLPEVARVWKNPTRTAWSGISTSTDKRSEQNGVNAKIAIFDQNHCEFQHYVELRSLGEGYGFSRLDVSHLSNADEQEEMLFKSTMFPELKTVHCTHRSETFKVEKTEIRLVDASLTYIQPNHYQESFWTCDTLEYILRYFPEILKHPRIDVIPSEAQHEETYQCDKVHILVAQTVIDMRAFAAAIDAMREGKATTTDSDRDCMDIDDDGNISPREWNELVAKRKAKASMQLFHTIHQIYTKRRSRLHLGQVEQWKVEHIPSQPGNLHPYQCDAVRWMLDREHHCIQNGVSTFQQPLYKECVLGGGTFYFQERNGSVEWATSLPLNFYIKTGNVMQRTYRGGILADEMGLGKSRTVVAYAHHAARHSKFPEQWESFINNNASTGRTNLHLATNLDFITHSDHLSALYPPGYSGEKAVYRGWKNGYYPHNSELVKTQATLLVVPNHLFWQWMDEIGHIYPPEAFTDGRVLTVSNKTEHGRYTYGQFAQAELVLVTRNFLCNQQSYMSLFFDPQFQLYTDLEGGSRQMALRSWYAMGMNREKLVSTLQRPLFELFGWPRVVYDEAHEGILNSHKEYSYMEPIWKGIPALTRWAVTGTPFVWIPSRVRFYFPSEVSMVSKERVVKFLGLCRAKDKDELAFRAQFNFVLSDLYWCNTKRNTESVNYLLPVRRTTTVVDLPVLQRILAECLLSKDVRAVMQTVPIMPPTCDRPGFMQLLSTKDSDKFRDSLGDYVILKTVYQYTKHEEKIQRLRAQGRLVDAERVFKYGQVKKKKKNPLDKKKKNKIREEDNDDDSESNSDDWMNVTLSLKMVGMPFLQALDLPTCYQAWIEYYTKAYEFFESRKHVRDYLPDMHSRDHWEPFLKRIRVALEKLKQGWDLAQPLPPPPALTLQMGGKIASLLEVLDKAWEEDQESCILVASQHTPVLKMIKLLLEKRKIQTVTLAAHNVASKTKSMKAIQDESSQVRVVLLDLKYTSSGANIVRANHIILFDTTPPSNQSIARNVEDQAIARLHRQTQDKQVTLTRLVARGFSEHLALCRLGLCDDSQVELPLLLKTSNVTQQTPPTIDLVEEEESYDSPGEEESYSSVDSLSSIETKNASPLEDYAHQLLDGFVDDMEAFKIAIAASLEQQYMPHQPLIEEEDEKGAPEDERVLEILHQLDEEKKSKPEVFNLVEEEEEEVMDSMDEILELLDHLPTGSCLDKMEIDEKEESVDFIQDMLNLIDNLE